MSQSLGDMGTISASAEGAEGKLHLRPGDGGAMDYSAEGLTLTYEVNCK